MSDLLQQILKKGPGRASEAPHASRPSPPALTGGERLKEGAKVDWCTLTWKPDPDEYVPGNTHDWFSDALGGVMGEEVNGLFGYDKGVRFYVAVGGTPVHVGRVDFGGEHHGGRARLELSGAGCSRVRSWTAFADRVRQLDEFTLTRVDLAVDALEGEFGVEDAVEWYQAGDFNAGGRNPRHSLVGDWLSPKHGRTFEVGRRENGKMLRCYEKGRQLGDQTSPWTRFEVEIRNNDRDIPLDILTDSDKYFTGAYRCLERVLDAAAERIKTHQKEGDIALEHLVTYAKSAYGQVINILRTSWSAQEVIDELSRPGTPKRLERASLLGFLTRSPTDLLQ